MDEEFNDCLTGEQLMTIAVLVGEYEDGLAPEGTDPPTDDEHAERMVQGLTPIARYLHAEGIRPTDFGRHHTRDNYLLPAYTMAAVIAAADDNPEAFQSPDNPTLQVPAQVLRNVGLID